MQRLFDIKRTQIQLAYDRGFDTSAEDEILKMTSVNEFVQYINKMITTHKISARYAVTRLYQSRPETGKNKSLLVYYGSKTNPSQKMIPAEVIREFTGLTQVNNVSQAILIVDAAISSTGNAELAAVKSPTIQIFHDSELTYNPSLRVDVPLHRKIPKKEAKLKMQELKTNSHKLPIIKLKEPIIKYYGWKIGDLICIERNDFTVSILSPKSANYRIVIG